MFSFQFGTFESSTPGWFEWLSLGLTLVVSAGSIIFTYWLANRTFKQEQNAQIENEKKLALQDINLLKKFLLDFKLTAQNQVNNLKNETIKNFSVIIKEPDFNSLFINHLNFNRIYHHDSKKVEILNSLIVSLDKLKDFNSDLEILSKNYLEKIYLEKVKLNNLINSLDLTINSIKDKREYSEEKAFLDISLKGNINYLSSISSLKDRISSNRQFINPNTDERNSYIVDNYIKSLKDLSKQYTLYDARQIEVSCNEIISLYNEILAMHSNHERDLKFQIDKLVSSIQLIDQYLS